MSHKTQRAPGANRSAAEEVLAIDERHHSAPVRAKIKAPSRIGALRDRCVELLREHEHAGALPTSSRFLFYELVQRGHLSKEKKGAQRPDQILHAALIQLRNSETIPWDWIVDETRSIDDFTGYETIKQGAIAVLEQVHLDPWNGEAPTVLTESRSLAGVLRAVAEDYAVRIAATNGYCGGFLRTDVAPRLQPNDRVIYLGDLDLAGGQIENNTRRVLEQEIGGELRWERLALTKQQVTKYDLPILTKRDRRYLDERPHQAVETEALSQTVLVDILRRRLNKLLPEPLSHIQERAERQRRRIAAELGGGA